MPRLLPLFLALTTLALGGCANTGTGGEFAATPGVHLRTPPGTDADIAWQGDRSAIGERLELVARTPDEWLGLWSKIGLPAPISLASNRMAVAIFLGSRATSGYAVVLDQVTARGAETVVPYREAVPGPDDPVDQTATAPFGIRLFDLKPGPVRFALSP